MRDCACANIGVTVDGKVVIGRRLHNRAGDLACAGIAHKARAALSGLVGGGMAAGAAFAHPRAADARVRPNFFNQI